MFNDKSIYLAAKASGIDKFIETLPNKYETYLTKYLYEGIDLSGGQWQKLALSRAFIRNSEYLILDEPTAALDPKSELDIFSKFVSLSVIKFIIIHKMEIDAVFQHLRKRRNLRFPLFQARLTRYLNGERQK